MSLGSDFRHKDRVLKARRVRTTRGSRHYKQPIGTVITRDLPLDLKAAKDRDERADRLRQAKSLVTNVSMEADTTPGPLSVWQMNQLTECYRWLFDYRRRNRDKIDYEVENAMADIRSIVDRQTLAKARRPVDGDGDGFVYDATPKKRPATPAERAAGAALRAAQGKGGAKGRPAAKKAAAKPPKNDYDKRYDKFDRAITQAIRAKDPKKVKEVKRLIEQDFVLKKPDRDDLVAVLNARRDGLPDPPPVKGSSREKRGVGVKAPIKAPAKKAAAKKPFNNGVDLDESDHEERIKAFGVGNKDGLRREKSLIDQNPALDTATKARLKAKADKKIGIREQGDQMPAPRGMARKRPAKKPGPVTRAHQQMREAGLDIPEKPPAKKAPAKKHSTVALDGARARMKYAGIDYGHGSPQHMKAKAEYERMIEENKGAKTPAKRPAKKAPGRIREAAAKTPEFDVRRRGKTPSGEAARTPLSPDQKTDFGELPDGPETKAYEGFANAKDVPDLVKAMNAADKAFRDGLIDQKTQREIYAEFNRRRQAMVDARKAPTPKTTSHGPKTKAWQRLVVRDIGKANTFRDLKRLQGQIKSLHGQKRISDNERDELSRKVLDRLGELGLDANGHQVAPRRRNGSALDRIRSVARQAVQNRQGPQTQQRKAVEHARDKLIEQINAAKDLEALDAVKAGIHPNDKRALREHPDLVDQINRAFKARRGNLKESQEHGAMVQAFDRRLANAARLSPARKRAAIEELLQDLQQQNVLGQDTQLEIIDRAEAIYHGRPDPKQATVHPKLPPGEARDRAIDAGGVQRNPAVEEHERRIDRVRDYYALEDVVRRLANDPNLDDDEAQELMDRAFKVGREKFDPGDGSKPANGPNGNWNLIGPPWAAPIRKGSPAAKHFEKGGGLEDAPENGLFDYLMQQVGVEQSQFHVEPGNAEGRGGAPFGLRPMYEAVEPDKYRVTNLMEKGQGGISPNYFVEELNPDGSVKSWRMFKGSNGYQAFDIDNEVICNDILRRLGVDVPKVQYARDPKHDGPKWLAMENAGVLLPDFDPNKGAPELKDAVRLRDRDRLMEHRNEVLFMDIFDWMIENTDRHDKNWMYVSDGKGGPARPVIIDNGGAFQHHRRRADPNFSPERQMSLIRSLYSGGGDQMLQDAKRIIDMLARLDVDDLMKTYEGRDNGPEMEAHLAAIRRQLEVKLRTIRDMRPEDIARAYGVR